jgi:hypothetical protein
MRLGPYRLTIRRADGTRVREKRLLSRFRLASINRNSGKRWAKGEQLRGWDGQIGHQQLQGVDKNERALWRIAVSAFPDVNVNIGDNLCVTPGQPRIARRCDVRFGSLADIREPISHVRSAFINGHGEVKSVTGKGIGKGLTLRCFTSVSSGTLTRVLVTRVRNVEGGLGGETNHHLLHGLRMPRSPARGFDFPPAELGRHAAERITLPLHFAHEGGEIGSTLVRLGAILRREDLGTMTAQTHASCLGSF